MSKRRNMTVEEEVWIRAYCAEVSRAQAYRFPDSEAKKAVLAFRNFKMVSEANDPPKRKRRTRS